MISTAVHHLCELLRRPLAAADAGMNRLYGWRFNPLYQSGTLVLLSFVVMLVTGLYLLLFYRIGSPYESMVRIDAQIFSGRWIRALHRYASDLAIAASALHVLRMFVQRRSWGPRTLAWVSGMVLLFFTFVCGWTGYVMLWDEQAQLLAVEGARLLDALPLFAEPIGRTFVGDRPLPSAFFFLNLFAHIALPIALGVILWIHISRVSRPVLMPPRRLLWGCVLALFAASLLAPAPLGPKANLLALPDRVELDWFYSFWIPASRSLEAATAWGIFAVFSLVLILVPWWSRPPREERPAPSVSPGRLCTGCDQCSVDCPYEAIAMRRLEDLGLDHDVAQVTPELCVACGICAASCAPMAVGPPLRTGRDELDEVRAFIAAHRFDSKDVVLVACRRGAGRLGERSDLEGAPVYPVTCVGNLHTSVIEFLLRSGAGGVLVASCPPRDCWSREGPKWLEERVYHGREAELRESLDRRRIAITYAAEAERGVVRRALAGLRTTVADLERAEREEESEIQIETECEPSEVSAP